MIVAASTGVQQKQSLVHRFRNISKFCFKKTANRTNTNPSALPASRCCLLPVYKHPREGFHVMDTRRSVFTCRSVVVRDTCRRWCCRGAPTPLPNFHPQSIPGRGHANPSSSAFCAGALRIAGVLCQNSGGRGRWCHFSFPTTQQTCARLFHLCCASQVVPRVARPTCSFSILDDTKPSTLYRNVV